MHSLLLHCKAPLWRPASPDHVAGALSSVGLTGVQEGGDALLYRAGERFLTLIMFLGCSPRISLTAQQATDGQPVCRIRLHDYSEVQWLESRPAPVLRCAACRAPQKRPTSLAYDRQQHCSTCGESVPLYRLDWRRGAGFGRFFVEIEHVFPHEAVPTDGLMSILEALSGNSWDYFYLSR